MGNLKLNVWGDQTLHLETKQRTKKCHIAILKTGKTSKEQNWNYVWDLYWAPETALEEAWSLSHVPRPDITLLVVWAWVPPPHESRFNSPSWLWFSLAPNEKRITCSDWGSVAILLSVLISDHLWPRTQWCGCSLAQTFQSVLYSTLNMRQSWSETFLIVESTL